MTASLSEHEARLRSVDLDPMTMVGMSLLTRLAKRFEGVALIFRVGEWLYHIRGWSVDSWPAAELRRVLSEFAGAGRQALLIEGESCRHLT
jgi:hypothetical protein